MQDADWVKAQSFSFEGNADQVASLFMAAEDWRQVDERIIHLTKDNQFMMEAVLGAMTAPRAFVSIGVTASVAAVGAGQEPVWSLENDVHEWLHSAFIGEIALHQVEAGKCIGELWIEQDPRKLGSDVSSLWHLAHHFMGELWHQLVSEWIESRTEILKVFGVHLDSGQATPPLTLHYVPLKERIASIQPERATEEWWNQVFLVYSEYHQNYRATQKELADATGYALSHIKRKLGEWKAEHDTK